MVTQRPWAQLERRVAPPRSICASSQPPKMSPSGLVSAGMAMTRPDGLAFRAALGGGGIGHEITTPVGWGPVHYVAEETLSPLMEDGSRG